MADSNKPETFPRQGWAHKDGRVDIRPLGEAPFTADQLLDRALINDAFARFGIAHDENRKDVLITCFTEDGVVEVARGSGEPFVVMNGRAEILKSMGASIDNQADQRRHLMTNIVIDRLEPPTASAIAYGAVPVAADGLILGASVFYSTELRKEADGFWRFTRFFIGMDAYIGAEPNPDNVVKK